jgi:hypothetical protein
MLEYFLTVSDSSLIFQRSRATPHYRVDPGWDIDYRQALIIKSDFGDPCQTVHPDGGWAGRG